MNLSASSIDPRKTVLLLGAGSSFSSGAPLAIDLCRLLEKSLAGGEKLSDNLAETASILENRRDRRSVIDVVVGALKNLNPDGGLISLAAHPWRAIYSTNYDRLIEDAFDAKGTSLSTIRSHNDFENAHAVGSVPLFKIHGCMTQDRSLGHKASMILTEEDYSEFESYRKLIFNRLAIDLAGSTTWIIGYSLRDPHIKSLIDDALRLQKEQDARGQINVLVYDWDEDRARLYKARGVHEVAKGDLNSFAAAMAQTHVTIKSTATSANPAPLPPELEPCTVVVNGNTISAHPKRMFFGSTASYGDIRDGFTFQRDIEADLLSCSNQILTITGVAGIGKSTLARTILSKKADDGTLCFEHRTNFPLNPDAWVNYESEIAETNRKAILLIDNCPPFQRQVNQLVRRLPNESALRVLVTAETSTWKPRQKDARFFTSAKEVTLGALSRTELASLHSLITRTADFRQMIPVPFSRMNRSEQLDHLRRRCSSDMFVCLKVLTDSSTLDDIILREYAAIEQSAQEIYRLTSALEAAGALPHRQMVLRLSGLSAGMVASTLEVLEGLIEEAEQKEAYDNAGGIYIWRTRHEVIASIIARYKYSDPEERYDLYERIIKSSNPMYFVEQRSVRELCTNENGIPGLPAAKDRISLYRLVATVMPNDRVSRHRLVRELIHANQLGDAEVELKQAVKDLRLDPPLQRYRIKLLIERSRLAPTTVDSKALIRLAADECEAGLAKFADSKYMYFVTADVAQEWYELTSEKGMLEWAIVHLKRGYEQLHDPDVLKRYDSLRAI